MTISSAFVRLPLHEAEKTQTLQSLATSTLTPETTASLAAALAGFALCSASMVVLHALARVTAFY